MNRNEKGIVIDIVLDLEYHDLEIFYVHKLEDGRKVGRVYLPSRRLVNVQEIKSKVWRMITVKDALTFVDHEPIDRRDQREKFRDIIIEHHGDRGAIAKALGMAKPSIGSRIYQWGYTGFANRTKARKVLDMAKVTNSIKILKSIKPTNEKITKAIDLLTRFCEE